MGISIWRLTRCFIAGTLTQSVYVLREREDSLVGGLSNHPDSLQKRLGPQPKRFTPTVCLPEMRKGRVGIMLSTIMCRVQNPHDNTHNAVRTQDVAYARGQSHLAYYRALERCGEIRFIKSVADLNACVADWENPSDDTPVGLILSMESADPILGPDQVGEWYEAGLRSVSLTHFGANTYGHGTGTVGGLYPPAYALMDALAETDIALDLTHAADLTFWHILDYWKGPVHASHCNCRALVPGQRHLSDDMIRAITDRGGVIGMVFCRADAVSGVELGRSEYALYHGNPTDEGGARTHRLHLRTDGQHRSHCLWHGSGRWIWPLSFRPPIITRLTICSVF